MCFQWAFMKLALGFGDNGGERNSWVSKFWVVFISGLQQQGIFRVPGSQVEVNDIKNSFERGESKVDGIIFPFFMSQMLKRDKPCFTKCHHWTHTCSCRSGEDPLVDDQNEHDINSVAGVLKLYFRGLENPLFPKERFLDFISTISESRAAENNKIQHRSLVDRSNRKRQNTPCVSLETLPKRRKARRAARWSNLNASALCLMCNREPVGRGECASSPQNHFPAVSAVIVWSLSVP